MVVRVLDPPFSRAKDIAHCCGCGKRSWMAVAVASSTARWRIRTAGLVAWSSRMLSSNSDGAFEVLNDSDHGDNTVTILLVR